MGSSERSFLGKSGGQMVFGEKVTGIIYFSGSEITIVRASRTVVGYFDLPIKTSI